MKIVIFYDLLDILCCICIIWRSIFLLFDESDGKLFASNRQKCWSISISWQTHDHIFIYNDWILVRVRSNDFNRFQLFSTLVSSRSSLHLYLSISKVGPH